MANLFDYSVNLQPAVMDIRSETLEPISSSTHRYVFRLDQAGQLDSNSVLLFKPELQGTGAADDTKARVGAFAGGLLAIKRAIFQVGDYVLNDVQDVGRISNLVDMGSVNTANNSKYNSHYFLNNHHYKVAENGGSGAGKNIEVGAGGEGTIIYDRARSAIDYGTPGTRDGGGNRVNNCMIRDNIANNHQIGIPLGNLFPCLKGQELPLFLFQDYRILLTFEFETCDKWCASSRVDNGNVMPAGQVLAKDVKLQVDYIIYPSEVQNQLREQTNQQGGLNLSFFDIIKVEKNIPKIAENGVSAAESAITGQEQSVEHRLGMDNKEVHKIYMLKKLVKAQASIDDRLFLNARCDGMNQEEYNVNIDGVDVFQEFKYNPASQYNETTYCLGAELSVPRPVYFNDENTIASRLADVNGGLLGKYKPLCLDLANGNPGIVGGGRQIGAYPIIWKYKRRPTRNLKSAFSNGTAAQNGAQGVDLCEDMRGALEVDYFVYASRTANVMSSPTGTQVMVAY